MPKNADEASPSRGATPELTVAKHALRDWIDAELTSGAYRTSPDIEAAAFAADLNARLRDQKASPIRGWSDNGLLIVATSFPIACGSDDSLYGWAWDGTGWRRAITHETLDYTPDRYRPL